MIPQLFSKMENNNIENQKEEEDNDDNSWANDNETEEKPKIGANQLFEDKKGNNHVEDKKSTNSQNEEKEESRTEPKTKKDLRLKLIESQNEESQNLNLNILKSFQEENKYGAGILFFIFL